MLAGRALVLSFSCLPPSLPLVVSLAVSRYTTLAELIVNCNKLVNLYPAYPKEDVFPQGLLAPPQPLADEAVGK